MLYKTAKRVIVFVVGITVLLLGLAMSVLPGPAILVVPLGLAILATEFAWAGYFLRKYKRAANSIVSTIKSGVSGKPRPDAAKRGKTPPLTPEIGGP